METSEIIEKWLMDQMLLQSKTTPPNLVAMAPVPAEASTSVVAASSPDAAQTNITGFLDNMVAKPPSPVLHRPADPSPPALAAAGVPQPDGKRSSSRPAKKQVVAGDPAERAREVQMKKWGILGPEDTPKEEHKKRFVAMFKKPLPTAAIKAVDDLFKEDGKKKAVKAPVIGAARANN